MISLFPRWDMDMLLPWRVTILSVVCVYSVYVVRVHAIRVIRISHFVSINYWIRLDIISKHDKAVDKHVALIQGSYSSGSTNDFHANLSKLLFDQIPGRRVCKFMHKQVSLKGSHWTSISSQKRYTSHLYIYDSGTGNSSKCKKYMFWK